MIFTYISQLQPLHQVSKKLSTPFCDLLPSLENHADINIFSDDTWYITRDLYGEDGDLRSLQKEDVSVPKLGWEFFDPSYFDNNFDNCKTRCENMENIKLEI